jgi:uncharacterized protein YrzB (UPF0473 family)
VEVSAVDQHLQNLFDQGLEEQTLGIYLQALVAGEKEILRSLMETIRLQLGISAPLSELDVDQRQLFEELSDVMFAFDDLSSKDQEEYVQQLLFVDDQSDDRSQETEVEIETVSVETEKVGTDTTATSPNPSDISEEVDSIADVLELPVPAEQPAEEDIHSQCVGGV